MIGQYVNTGRGSRVTISPAVPGAQYSITAWALGDGRRSATPAVVDATAGEAGWSYYTCVQIRTYIYVYTVHPAIFTGTYFIRTYIHTYV